MPYRNIHLGNENYYHIFNRGIDKQLIFKQKKDYQRFLDSIHYYQFDTPKPKFSQRHRYKHLSFNSKKVIVEIIAYCLMPNHFHLLVKQIKTGGIQEFISKLCNSHSSYFNLKYKRAGDLFQNEFIAVAVETDEQLLHLSRYIHLNPFVSDLVENPENYIWSSYQEYLKNKKGLCQKEIILNFFLQKSYSEFVNSHQDYAKKLHKIKHLTLE